MQAMPMEDPRDDLSKLTRDQLWAYAKMVGVSEVREPMPKLQCEAILRAKGFTKSPFAVAPLGAPPGVDPYAVESHAPAADANAEFIRQYEQQQKNPDPLPSELTKLSGHEIRKELKRRGVKMSRTDTLEILKAKLNGEQNAS